MRIRDQTGYRTQQSERFDFEMSRIENDFSLLQGNVRIVLFVDVEVLDQSLMQECVKREKLVS